MILCMTKVIHNIITFFHSEIVMFIVAKLAQFILKHQMLYIQTFLLFSKKKW